MALTLTEAQRLLLGIISSVESGITTPEEAVTELADLKAKAVKANIPTFQADYTLENFQSIRDAYVSEYESSYEPTYDTSTDVDYDPSY
jgi:hypothetical protein